MLIPTLIMGTLAVGLFIVGVRRGQGEQFAGALGAAKMLIQMLPLLILALFVANMVQVLVPREFIAKWVGAESGYRGIILGSVAGMLSPGGPYVNYPTAVALMKAGASTGVMVAFLTAWSLHAVTRLPLELGFLGWKFTVIRYLCSFLFAPIAGFLAQRLFGGVKL